MNRWPLQIWLLVIALGASIAAHASRTPAVDIVPGVQKLALWPALHVVKAGGRSLEPAQVAALAPGPSSLTVDSPHRIFGRGDGAFWGAFAVHNARQSGSEYLLALEATTLFNAQLFMLEDSGVWSEVPSWAKNARGSLGGGTIHPVWTLQIPPGKTLDMLLLIEGDSIIRFPVFLYSPEAFVISERKINFLVGTTFGIFLFIGVYIASLRRHLRDRSVPLFGIILVADLVGAFWLSGVWSAIFPSVPESMLSPIGFGAYAILFGCGSWHARLYLNTGGWAPGANRILLLLGWLWLCLAPWFAVTFPGNARILLVWGGTATALMVVAVSIFAARKQIRFSGYEAATWLTSLLFVMSYMIARAFDQPLLWSSSALALVQATAIAILYGVAMSQHLLRQKDLTEQSQKEAVLERETVAARMRERSLIYAATNHDLRQPLLGVSVFADLLKSARTEEDRSSYSVKLSLALSEVDDILVSMQQLSAVNEESNSPALETVYLHEILVPLIEEYRSRSQYKNATIRYVPSRVLIHTHIPYFQRIVRNALSNAIRYIGPGGRILVGCRRGGGLRLVVADTGRGMSKEQTEKAFDAFTRFDPATANTDGAGLGLFSTKSLATSLGLSVSLASREGRGTVFSVEIPWPPSE